MSTVLFYEKPGCMTNAMQKILLRTAGLHVVERNILREKWSAERLRTFFTGMPIPAWFNPAAPSIRDGKIKPGGMSEEQALAHMLAEPLLIRRPLIEVDELHFAGFEPEILAQSLGGDWPSAERVRECMRHDDSPCPLPGKRD